MTGVSSKLYSSQGIIVFLKALLLNLLLRRFDGRLRIRIGKIATGLAILERGGFGRADTDAASIGTAARGAVGVVDTSAGDELGAVGFPHVSRAGVVRLDLRQCGDGHCKLESAIGDWLSRGRTTYAPG